MKSFTVTIQGTQHVLTLDEADSLLIALAQARTQCEPRALDLPKSFDGLPAIRGGQVLHGRAGTPLEVGGMLLLFAPLFGWMSWEVGSQAARELHAWAEGRDADPLPGAGDLN